MFPPQYGRAVIRLSCELFDKCSTQSNSKQKLGLSKEEIMVTRGFQSQELDHWFLWTIEKKNGKRFYPFLVGGSIFFLIYLSKKTENDLCTFLFSIVLFF